MILKRWRKIRCYGYNVHFNGSIFLALESQERQGSLKDTGIAISARVAAVQWKEDWTKKDESKSSLNPLYETAIVQPFIFLFPGSTKI